MASVLFIVLSNLTIDRIPFWPFVVTLFLVSAILYTRAMNANNWTLVLRSIFSPRAVQQLIREENTMDNTFSGVLVLTFFFSLALFFYNVNEFFEISTSVYPLLTYFLVLTVLFLTYLIKVLALFMVQLIFETKELFEEYLVSLMNINIVLGACLIPINLMIVYGVSLPKGAFIYIGITLLIGSFIIRYSRLFEMGIRKGMKAYNIILYLCTLEIIPIALFIKLLDNVGINLNLL